jgi:S1-C subfamily serine protease
MVPVVLVLLASTPAAESPLLTPAPTVLAQQEHQRALYERTAPTVVHLRSASGIGSGLLVSPAGHILTNAHVVGSATSLEAVLFDGRRLNARVIERSANNIDLALLKLDVDGPLPFQRLAGGPDPRPGDFIAAVGHGAGAVWTFNIGMVSNIHTTIDKTRIIQTQVPLNPGNSGGPVIEINGRVVGIVTAGLTGANSINFAIPIDFAVTHLAGLGPLCACAVVSAPTHVPIFVDGTMVGTGPQRTVLLDGKRHEFSAVVESTLRRVVVEGTDSVKVNLNTHPAGH